MPELPEVEVVRAGLEPAVTSATISSVEVLDERGITRHDRTVGELPALLTGRRMLGAARRGKFLWLPIAADVEAQAQGALLIHLGMSGQVLLREAGDPAGRHARVRLVLEHPQHGELAVHFVDQRTFGSLAVDTLIPTVDGAPGGLGTDLSLVPSQVSHIARDPLDPAFDDEGFLRALATRRTTVKRALLDQTLISGVGNIYADEALWAARVHYEQPTQTLSRRKARELLAEVRLVLQKALAEGGTSFDAQYVNVNGASGYFAHSLEVYGREGESCSRCGTKIARRPFMNRSSHFCPRCQVIRSTSR
ncbi:MAG: bifunctional DNA-formamidopyrimidine glycosylase/DNA-(apurinic or apyrimidinic site) lyase [Humibacter sp.]